MVRNYTVSFIVHAVQDRQITQENKNVFELMIFVGLHSQYNYLILHMALMVRTTLTNPFEITLLSNVDQCIKLKHIDLITMSSYFICELSYIYIYIYSYC